MSWNFMRNGSFWNDEKNTEKLIDLLKVGHTYRAIAKIMGITSNMVAGRVDRIKRLGLYARPGVDPKTVQPNRRKVIPGMPPQSVAKIKKARITATLKKTTITLQDYKLADETERRNKWLSLGPNSCKFLIGNDAPFDVCGKEGNPWCDEHRAIVYVKRN
jgi:hypothetical protein